MFRNERYLTKSKKLSDTITKVDLPKSDDKGKKQRSTKPAVKKLGDAQKHIDVARARGTSLKEMLCFGHLTNYTLFDEDLTAKPNKSELKNWRTDFLLPSTTSLQKVSSGRLQWWTSCHLFDDILHPS